jgi:hypothetical protein
LAFEERVLERKRETSWGWPREAFVRRGERRRGTGRAMGVGVWEGILGDVDVDEDFGKVAGGVFWEVLGKRAEGRVSRTFCKMEGQEKGLT